MPKEVDHRTQARHNRAFVEFVKQQGSYDDWALTACFYSALHLIDAVLVHFANCHPVDHAERDSAIGRCSQIPRDVFNAYFTLKDDSTAARYNCWQPTNADVANGLSNLTKVEQFVRSKLP